MSSSLKIRSFIGLAFVLLVTVAALVYLGTGNSSAVDRSPDDVMPAVKPAGRLVLDAATGQPAVAPLTVNFVRSPDGGGPDGKGRFLIAVNGGYGLTFNAKSKAQQTLSVIDLDLKPEPKVVQNIYFPAPQ